MITVVQQISTGKLLYRCSRSSDKDIINCSIWKKIPVEDLVQIEVTEDEWFDSQNPYDKLRRNDYIDIRNQLDMIYWDRKNGTDHWVSHISEVKNKHPKE